MSRDLRPIELHLADIEIFKKDGKYLHDISIVWKDANGNEIDGSCKRNPELWNKYPNLCFLWGVSYVEEAAAISEEKLLSMENYLSEVINRFDKDFHLYASSVKDDSPAIVKWYLGELDPGYYMEDNNRALLEYFKEKIKKFDSHNAYDELDDRTGTFCEIIRELTKEEADIDEVGPMYLIKFLADGFEADAFADELEDTLDNT